MGGSVESPGRSVKQRHLAFFLDALGLGRRDHRRHDHDRLVLFDAHATLLHLALALHGGGLAQLAVAAGLAAQTGKRDGRDDRFADPFSHGKPRKTKIQR